MSVLPVENVVDYPRPPALQPVDSEVRVVLAGGVVAATRRAWRVLETFHAPTYYLPPEDVAARLAPVAGRSFCEWKGLASYWDVTMGGVTRPRAAWSYAEPNAGFTPIAGFLAFYSGAMEACYVGGHRVVPQPGSFYGGWITDNLRGPIKGAPGTEHW